MHLKTLAPVLLALSLLPNLSLAQKKGPLTFHSAPKPLASGAVVEDWPRFLGAHDNATSRETKLLKKWPEGGPKKVWELETGEGYACPILAEGKLIYFHRLRGAGTDPASGREVIDCLEPETGKRTWRFEYPVVYRDRYGFSPGPRSSPVVHQGRIYVVGVTAVFHCLDLKTGKKIWNRDLKNEYNIPPNFFGYGPTPVLWKDRLIVNVGGSPTKEGDGVCVAALDIKTGKTLWEVKDKWGASYASPTITKLHGRDCALVIAAGESRPPHGGLLTIDPLTGKVHDRFPWRANIYESVLASSPLVLGNNQVYFGDCYAVGGVTLQFDEELKSKVLWKERFFGMHWTMPLHLDGHLYGFAGRNIPDTQFKCANAKTGEIIWEKDLEWRDAGRTHGLFRASMLHADGRIFCLGEDGVLAELKLSPKGPKFLQKIRLFAARSSWTLPSLHRGLLYVSQNDHDLVTKAPPRIICYDFRGE